MEFRFGDFRLDRATRQLATGDRECHLSRKAFDLLARLIETAPKVLSKPELLEFLWPHTYVVEANLAVLIKEIRRALGDSATRSRFIRTVHGVGYAFHHRVVSDERIAPQASTAQARYWLVTRTEQWRLADGENLIGRDPTGAVCFDSIGVSRRHARVVVTSDGVTLEDLGSKNGTYLRGMRLASPSPLRHGDEIRVGTEILTFRVRACGESTETQVGP